MRVPGPPRQRRPIILSAEQPLNQVANDRGRKLKPGANLPRDVEAGREISRESAAVSDTSLNRRRYKPSDEQNRQSDEQPADQTNALLALNRRTLRSEGS
jgi:hypothetical protein